MSIAAGIDLSGPKNLKNTYLAILAGTAKPTLICLDSGLSDEQLKSILGKYNAEIVAIDAPLSKPRGTFRKCDTVLRSMLKNYSSTFPRYVMPPLSTFQMRALTERGIRLKRILASCIKVLETHPRASLLFMTGMTDIVSKYKGENPAERKVAIAKITDILGKLVDFSDNIELNDHGIDAIVSAYVAFLYCSRRDLLLNLQKRPEFWVISPEARFHGLLPQGV